MRLRTVGAVLIGATAVAALAAGGAAAAPDGDPTLVPGAVHLPLPLTRTVRDAPAGPAALIVTGEGALRGSDVLGGYEGRTLVVGGDGRYRLVAGAAEDEAATGRTCPPTAACSR